MSPTLRRTNQQTTSKQSKQSKQILTWLKLIWRTRRRIQGLINHPWRRQRKQCALAAHHLHWRCAGRIHPPGAQAAKPRDPGMRRAIVGTAGTLPDCSDQRLALKARSTRWQHLRQQPPKATCCHAHPRCLPAHRYKSVLFSTGSWTSDDLSRQCRCHSKQGLARPLR